MIVRPGIPGCERGVVEASIAAVVWTVGVGPGGTSSVILVPASAEASPWGTDVFVPTVRGGGGYDHWPPTTTPALSPGAVGVAALVRGPRPATGGAAEGARGSSAEGMVGPLRVSVGDIARSHGSCSGGLHSWCRPPLVFLLSGRVLA